MERRFYLALRPFIVRDINNNLAIQQLLNNISFPMEIWKQICTAPYLDYIKEYYWISTYGRIFTTFNNYNSVMSQMLDRGYYSIRLRDIHSQPNTLSVNRLVMMVFCPISNYNDLDVNHLDGIKTNNYLWNLEWATRSENILHSFRIGLHIPVCGENCGNSKLNEVTVHKICKCLENPDYSSKEICEIVGLEYNKQNSNIIYTIKSKDTWNHISCNYNIIPPIPNLKYDENLIHKICKYLEDNISSKEICRLLNIPYDTNNIAYISKIKTKDTWKEISDLYNLPEPMITRRFDDTQIKIVCNCLNKNIKPKEICEKFLNIEYNENHRASIKYIKKKYNIKKVQRLEKAI